MASLAQLDLWVSCVRTLRWLAERRSDWEDVQRLGWREERLEARIRLQAARAWDRERRRRKALTGGTPVATVGE